MPSSRQSNNTTTLYCSKRLFHSANASPSCFSVWLFSSTDQFHPAGGTVQSIMGAAEGSGQGRRQEERCEFREEESSRGGFGPGRCSAPQVAKASEGVWGAAEGSESRPPQGLQQVAAWTTIQTCFVWIHCPAESFGSICCKIENILFVANQITWLFMQVKYRFCNVVKYKIFENCATRHKYSAFFLPISDSTHSFFSWVTLKPWWKTPDQRHSVELSVISPWSTEPRGKLSTSRERGNDKKAALKPWPLTRQQLKGNTKELQIRFLISY